MRCLSPTYHSDLVIFNCIQICFKRDGLFRSALATAYYEALRATWRPRNELLFSFIKSFGYLTWYMISAKTLWLAWMVRDSCRGSIINLCRPRRGDGGGMKGCQEATYILQTLNHQSWRCDVRERTKLQSLLRFSSHFSRSRHQPSRNIRSLGMIADGETLNWLRFEHRFLCSLRVNSFSVCIRFFIGQLLTSLWLLTISFRKFRATSYLQALKDSMLKRIWTDQIEKCGFITSNAVNRRLKGWGLQFEVRIRERSFPSFHRFLFGSSLRHICAQLWWHK